MRNFRRAVAAVVTVVALSLGGVTSVGIATASAAVADVTINDITYTTNTSTLPARATVTHYSGLGGAVEILPSVTINGTTMPVVAIGDYAFGCAPFDYQCDRYSYPVTSVVFPDTITTIGAGAFWGNALKTINLPSSVTTVGEQAFEGNKLASVVIPPKVTTIAGYAFKSNKLTSVTIPASVTTIGAGAFWYNELESVTIPASVSTIGLGAFSENGLQTVFLWGEAPSIDTSSDYWEPFSANAGIAFYIFPKHRDSYTSANSGWRFYGASVVDAPGGVDFDSNGHGEKPASQMYVTDRNIAVAPPAPSAPGYVFQGWYTQSGQSGLH